jgi:hypothetical protein
MNRFSVRGTVLTFAGLVIALPQPVAAQRLADYALVATRPPTVVIPALSTVGFQRDKKRTHWLEGGIVGGAFTGLIGVALAGACPPNTGSCPSNPVLGFVIGAVPGFILGGLLGDMIEKEPKPSPPQ